MSGFVRHVDDTNGLSGADDLEALYGPAAPHSEHKRGDHITNSSAKSVPTSGTIIWCQAPYRLTPYAGIGLRYVVAPDIDTGFVDIVWPDEVIRESSK
jgi:hypothetical protein